MVCIIKTTNGVTSAIDAMTKSGIFAGIAVIEPLDKISTSILDVEKFRAINTYDSTNGTIKASVHYYDPINKNTGMSMLMGCGVEKIDALILLQ